MYSPSHPSIDSPKYVSIHMSHCNPSIPILQGHWPSSLSQNVSDDPLVLHSHGGQSNVIFPYPN